MQKLNTLLAFLSENVLQLTSLPSEKNTKALWIALKRRIMNFGAIIGVFGRFNSHKYCRKCPYIEYYSSGRNCFCIYHDIPN